jgi:hypothetical protein
MCFSLSTLNTKAAEFTFDDIEFWVGVGAHRSALVIDWAESAAEPPALAWGYHWDGDTTSRDMLIAIVAADPRLFAKLGGTTSDPVAVYGLGYDSDNDGEYSIDDGTQFDSNGLAFSGPADLAVATDPGDFYAEGWFTAFWHFGVEDRSGANPYTGGGWSDTSVGMASRDLVDGSWDSWVFSPTFDFTSFAENPLAAPSPFSPGDFNQDGRVDADDYDVWRTVFGSQSHLAADANRNGFVDAADFVVWREHLATTAASTAALLTHVPEPTSKTIAAAAALYFLGIGAHGASKGGHVPCLRDAPRNT